MGNHEAVPERLYKYRSFSCCTLDLVVSDNLYFAGAESFNDPLDSRPCLEIDLNEDRLETILRTLVEQRVAAEMRSAATAMKVSGPSTAAHIERNSRNEADRVISGIEYQVTNPEYESGKHRIQLLGHRIERELLRRYDKGVVCLAERANCPLMWSHYGNQHRGICIGYSVPVEIVGDIGKVTYGGSRLVQASKVAEMLTGSDMARSEVDEAVLLRKAQSWQYEKEWRLFGPRELHDSPLELEEVVFGIRCKASIKYTVMKALGGRDRPVRFHELREQRGEFELKKEVLDYEEELFAHFPRRNRSIPEMFEPLPDTGNSC